MTSLKLSPNRSRRRRRRRAMLLVTMLVCLTVVMALVAAWMKTIALERRHVRAASDRVQAEYLATSGVERAMAQLAANPTYTGETWRIDADSLGARAGARVVIKIVDAADNSPGRRAVVEASFPDEGPRRARRTREVTLEK